MAALPKEKWISFLNLKTPQEIEHMQRIAVDSSRLGIPILFGHDIIHGCKIIFPINLTSACSWNLDAARIVCFLRDDAVGGIDPDADAEGRTAASCDNKVINNFLS